MENQLYVLVKHPGRNATPCFVNNELKALQEKVEGYIETLDVPNTDCTVICNEEGLINNLPYNCTINENLLFGTILIVGTDGEEFTDCPLSLAEAKIFIPELFENW